MKQSRFKRFVSATLIVAFCAATTEGLSAQQTAPPPAQSTGSTLEGQRDGELLADTVGTGGKVVGGVFVGALTGLIGTGIGYFIIGPQATSAEATQAQQGKSLEYQLGFKSGWAKKTKDKKRKSFLVGGLLGSALGLALLTAVSNSGG